MPAFWSEFKQRNAPGFQSWLSDQREFLLQMASVSIAFLAFKFLRIIGVPDWIISIFESLDHLAAILVFGLYIIGVLRRSVARKG